MRRSIVVYVANGDEVHVACMTRGMPELYSDEGVAHVREEAKRAHAEAWRYRDALSDFLASTRYRAALPACRDDCVGHSRQQVECSTFRITETSTATIFICTTPPGCARPLGYCPVRQILVYETISETEWAPPLADSVFYPTVFVDISGYLPLKLDAMACFESQVQPPPSARSLRTIESLARYRGATVSCDAAEGFMLVREIVR